MLSGMLRGITFRAILTGVLVHRIRFPSYRKLYKLECEPDAQQMLVEMDPWTQKKKTSIYGSSGKGRV